MRFDHVGVLVDDLEAAWHLAREVLGLGEPDEVRSTSSGCRRRSSLWARDAWSSCVSMNRAERLPAGERVRIDHVAVRVDDLNAEAARLRRHGVRSQGPLSPADVQAPVGDARAPAPVDGAGDGPGGFMLRLTEGAP